MPGPKKLILTRSTKINFGSTESDSATEIRQSRLRPKGTDSATLVTVFASVFNYLYLQNDQSRLRRDFRQIKYIIILPFFLPALPPEVRSEMVSL